MSKKHLPLFRLVISDDEDETGVHTNALVASPANGYQFIAFSKEEPIKLATNEMKRNVTGVLLAPEQRIYRRSEKRGEFDVFLTKEDIEKVVRRFSKRNRHNSMNLEHAVPIEGGYMVESWLVNSEQDKSKPLGFDVPAGTWMATFHIEDDAIWQACVNGTYRGFSIEGLFGLDPVALAEEVPYESFFASLLDDSISDADKMDLIEKTPSHACKLLRDVFNPMSISESLKQFFTKHPAKEDEKAPENKTPEVTNLMEDGTPSGETNPIDQRVSDLETAVKAILGKLDELLGKKPDEQAMAAIAKLEAQVEKLSNTPQTPPDDEDKKSTIKMNKEMKPAVANLIARLNQSKN